MSTANDDFEIQPHQACEQDECHEHECEGHETAAIGCGGAATMESEQEFYDSLPAGHMIRTFMDEHATIRKSLDALEVIANKLKESPEDRDALLLEMSQLGGQLVKAEPHHQREEDVLFPVLSQRGLAGPPSVMAHEHIEIRRLKHILADKPSLHMGDDGLPLKPIVDAALVLVSTLRQHIDKENRILYPMSMQVIREESDWSQLKERADEIGYM